MSALTPYPPFIADPDATAGNDRFPSLRIMLQSAKHWV